MSRIPTYPYSRTPIREFPHWPPLVRPASSLPTKFFLPTFRFRGSRPSSHPPIHVGSAIPGPLAAYIPPLDPTRAAFPFPNYYLLHPFYLPTSHSPPHPAPSLSPLSPQPQASSYPRPFLSSTIPPLRLIPYSTLSTYFFLPSTAPLPPPLPGHRYYPIPLPHHAIPFLPPPKPNRPY